VTVNNRFFVARYSRALRKALASKVIVDLVMRATLARIPATRRRLHLYTQRASPADMPHLRVDPGRAVVQRIPIDAAMETHLRRYTHGLDGCLEPGLLHLAAEVRGYELADCDILPWLGVTIHRPTGKVIAGGIDAQPSLHSKVREVPGRVLSVIGSPRGHNQYYHFFEGLTVIMHALSWLGEAEPITLLARCNLSSFQRVTLEALVARRPNLTLVEVDNDEIVRPEKLVLAERQPCPMICWFALIDEWREIGAMLRAAYGPAEAPFDRKLHLTRRRQKLRRLINESELEPVFGRHGYESIMPETLPHAGQVHLLMQASKVVAVEGAAITNILFADQPLKLYLMCPWETLNPFWEGLTTQLGHEFTYVESGKAEWNDAFRVEPADLDAALSG
jgi:Glycosyltransferase 61